LALLVAERQRLEFFPGEIELPVTGGGGGGGGGGDVELPGAANVQSWFGPPVHSQI